MGTLPPEVLRWLEERFGQIAVLGSVGGGCVNPAARLRLSDGEAFLKYNGRAAAGLFRSEADGLRALRSAADALRIPEVLATYDPEERGEPVGAGALLLEWLEPASEPADFGERLGHGLAALHHRSAEQWGWPGDGFIGPLPQRNRPAADWAGFWWERRLEPQLRRARETGSSVGSAREWDRLRERLPTLLAPAAADGPSLVHGDLWSGNVLAAAGARGAEPALVDPAAYHGHREVDLAMAELFGGFPHAFIAAYREAWPLADGYDGGRRPAYQLYYLLVHVNLFGGAYSARTERALREALAAA